MNLLFERRGHYRKGFSFHFDSGGVGTQEFGNRFSSWTPGKNSASWVLLCIYRDLEKPHTFQHLDSALASMSLNKWPRQKPPSKTSLLNSKNRILASSRASLETNPAGHLPSDLNESLRTLERVMCWSRRRWFLAIGDLQWYHFRFASRGGWRGISWWGRGEFMFFCFFFLWGG